MVFVAYPLLSLNFVGTHKHTASIAVLGSNMVPVAVSVCWVTLTCNLKFWSRGSVVPTQILFADTFGQKGTSLKL